jgi:hypothetical protein
MKCAGEPFSELHEWMDESYKELEENHRLIRHAYNTFDEKYILKRWGPKAVVEWLIHIAIDNLETAFFKSKDCYPDGCHIAFTVNGEDVFTPGGYVSKYFER